MTFVTDYLFHVLDLLHPLFERVLRIEWGYLYINIIVIYYN